MINTHFATGTAPKIKTFIGKHSHYYWNSSSKSKYSLANTRIATGTAPKIKTFIGKVPGYFYGQI
ncbi:hypothetical protein [Tenacibaculum finnmarkense]|uniref:hypothetical protein n=1 Tax=Tenacibaculum finnmarkense TaxID=2781243 RepID=UPI001EFB5579|nr:hypothetical protein [Tenacibaculum finnmarkense]